MARPHGIAIAAVCALKRVGLLRGWNQNHQRVRVVGAMSRDRGWAHEDFATKIADECELAVWTHGRVT